VQKDNLMMIPQATKEGFIPLAPGGVFDGSYPESTTRRGRVQEGGQVTPTLMTGGDNLNLYEEVTYRIRKLTPRECYRLMGVDDADIDTIQSSGISNTQQYKQAGNSIVVDVLYHIFRKMFVETESENRQLEFF
jgi:DNA (cytosine-5)-methyltransferase 1